MLPTTGARDGFDDDGRGLLGGRGENGFYWSSTTTNEISTFSSANFTYYLYLGHENNGGMAGISNNGGRLGLSVRCVAE